ncbi:Zn-dependent hydrolase [Limobrevibacterium gyesilva]|uniref:Zn-dependent hydrolase n=1 Tax=Limobrevibacterium gyesilva TaxID=2991712 RepID=A0AA42CIM4_9PROT|nr:Zn-dependent hydrolase [Limobrevibacterium gyesilva]MCW3476072.1 Zn-dependent hydrolase [Limobrevibacterium gyesilva]
MSGPAANLAIDGDRLWGTIMETARIGATPKGGICRLTLTDLDRQVRDWFRAACTAAGCTVTVDAMGNIFARRAGRDNSLKPIAIGSHLDTQPTGGKYDGIVGVLAGLEVLRTLNDHGVETNAPIEVIDWTNEEGSRFAPAMLSSGVFAGVFDTAYAYARQDRDGQGFGEALDRIGYKGDRPCGGHALGAHIELHIEQGPILEAEGKTIGVVTGVQGMRWYEVTLTGAESHAGSTPMPLRRDALLGAAHMIAAVNQVALAHAPDAVATVGLIESRPNSRNVVPGSVFFTIDLRHPDDGVLARMEAETDRALRAIAGAAGLGIAMERVWDSPAVRFDADCVAAVQRAADAAGHASRRIVSGAGHDSAYIARVAPTTMIFVPCEKGLSHNEAEHAEKSDVVAGADVLLRAVLDIDQRFAERAVRAG